MKHVLVAGGLLGLLGCSTSSGAARPVGPSFSCEAPGYVPEPHYRAEVPMGRLEVEKLPAVAPPPASPPRESEPEPESQQLPGSRRRPRFPATRMRVVAEAVPLGTLASALSRELGLGIVVVPRLVDLRVSVSLPEATAKDLFRLLEAHYDVVAEPEGDRAIVLEERLEVLHRRYESPEALVSIIPLEGLPAEHVASFYCKLLASEYGAAYVIGDTLIVKGEQRSIERLNVLIRALRSRDAQGASGASTGQETPP